MIYRMVLFKLVLFSILAIGAPLTVFYTTLSWYGSTVAGIMAAVSANLVLIAYIVVAYLEGEE